MAHNGFIDAYRGQPKFMIIFQNGSKMIYIRVTALFVHQTIIQYTSSVYFDHRHSAAWFKILQLYKYMVFLSDALICALLNIGEGINTTTLIIINSWEIKGKDDGRRDDGRI